MRQDTQASVGQQDRTGKELLIVQIQSVKLEGKMGGGVVVFFSDPMRGKCILLESQENIPIHC
jgi:hypothetical protein